MKTIKIEWYVTRILDDLNAITRHAEKRTACKRKGVGCRLINLYSSGMASQVMAFNGPSLEKFECTNEVGNCGCMHSEPKAIIEGLKKGFKKKEFIMLCTYSPCTNCANIIISSGIVKGIIYTILTEHDKRGDALLRGSIDVVTTAELKSRKANAIIKRWISLDPKH